MFPSVPAIQRPVAALLAATLLLTLLLLGSRFAAGQEPSPGITPAAVAPPLTAAAPTPAVAATAAPVPTATPAPGNPLGATPQEIVRLYGPVLKHNARVWHHQVLEGGTTLDGDLHGRNGIVIRVVYHEGHAILLEFTRVAGALSPADVKTILGTAANGAAWVEGKDSTDLRKFYRRTDDRAIAHYATDYDGSLLVSSEGFEHDKLLDNMMH